MSADQPRVHLYVHGRGRGHGTRARSIADRLQAQGTEVTVFAGPGAESAFGDAYPVTPVESLVPGMGLSTIGHLRNRVQDALAETREALADVVITDGDMPGAVAARLAGVPAVAVGHGLVFSHARRPAGVPRGPWLREAAKARSASVGTQRQVAVNFVPLESRVDTAIVARPVLRAALSEPGQIAPANNPEVVCYFRDDNGEAILRSLVDLGLAPVLFTSVGADIPGVTVRPPDSAAFADALLSARAVVSSAGSQLISECVALGVPQFALYAPSDDEQRLNVAMLKNAGLGDGCGFAEASTEILRDFVSDLDEVPAAPPEPWGPDAAEAVCDVVRQLLS